MECVLRLVGAAVTVLSALFYSFSKNSAVNARINKCKALLSFLAECRRDLECHSLPIAEIIRLSPYGTDAELVRAVKREGLAAAVEARINRLLDGEEERALLIEFAHGFGRGHTEGEAARCDRYIEMLKKHTEALENGAKAECKMRITVSLCVSLMAVLFFA